MPNIVDLILSRARGKALADLHPEVSDREHIASLRSDGASAYSGQYSYLNAISDYASHVWVRKAVTTIGNNVAALPLTIKRGDQLVSSHALLDLLTSVNDTMTSADLWQQWTVDMLLGGEEGWELVRDTRGRYAEIWPRQPHTILIKPDAARKRYYKVREYAIDDTSEAEPYTLQPDELCHFKFFNPGNPWRGIAPITAVRWSIVLDVFAQAWSKLFFQNSARPDFAVIAPEGLTASERADIEKKLTQKFGGVENSHKPIVLEQGISDVKILSFPPKDMEWLEQRKISREEVGAIFGVPDEIMGWGRDTYENFDTAHRVLWELTIVPLTRHRDVHLTEYFQRVNVLRPDERVITDLSGVGALKANETDEWSRAQGQMERGALLINEWRTARGLKAVPWGDVWWAPMGLMPISSADAPASAAPVADTPKSVGQKAAEFSGMVQRAAVVSNVVEYGSTEHAALLDAYAKRTDPFQRKFKTLAVALFDEQRDAVAAELRQAKKVARTRAEIANDPFDREEWTAEYIKRAKPLLRDIVASAGEQAINELGIGLRFDVDRPEIAAFIRERAQRFAKPVNDTTWEALRTSLGEGFDAGEGIDALMARVEQVMGDRISSSAETIARTETQGATSGGTIEAWKQTEVVSAKVWISALIPDRTREDHKDAHGQTVGLDEQFTVGTVKTDGPGLSGEADQDINCLCVMTAVVADKHYAPQSGEDGMVNLQVRLPRPVVMIRNDVRPTTPGVEVVNHNLITLPDQPAPTVTNVVQTPSVTVTNQVQPATPTVKLVSDGAGQEDIAIERDADGRIMNLKRSIKRG